VLGLLRLLRQDRDRQLRRDFGVARSRLQHQFPSRRPTEAR
jgi:hypothetical protein